MINFNGELVENELVLSASNRAFLYGDGVFETVKLVNGRVLFIEDHYFRLMASMRILRMEIPMEFTLEYFEQQLVDVAQANGCVDSARLRMTVFRNGNGYYLPNERTVGYIITATPLLQIEYQLSEKDYEVDLYKDFYIPTQLLSTLKTTNRALNVTGSIYAAENDLDNCFLINERKNVIEALQGNLFMLTGNHLVTPPLSEGCINGIMRKQIISLVKDVDGILFSELPISPFDLQKADELFITNCISGIIPVTKYRKKEFQTSFAAEMILKLNGRLS